MIPQLQKLWNCWISAREHRKPHWKTWSRLLLQMPMIASQSETEPYYSLYRDRMESGQYRAEPKARGRWVKGQWVMRSEA